MVSKDYSNIFLKNDAEAVRYKSKLLGGGNIELPPRSRNEHGKKIKQRLIKIWDAVEEEEKRRRAISMIVRNGTYLEFESAPNFDLKTKSLEFHKSGIQLLNVRKEKKSDGTTINKATVFIPKAKENYFLKKVDEYLKKETKNGNPKNKEFIESIEDIKLAVLESFWIGDKSWIPDTNKKWCEIWLNVDDYKLEETFRALLKSLNIEVKNQKLSFPERRVLFIHANKELLTSIIESSSLVAEMRRATEVATFFVDLDNKEQTDWAKDLIERININKQSNTVISILDTGINNGHILINPFLEDSDCYTYKKEWGTSDTYGHGTNMAGLSIYYDLQSALESKDNITVNHILESYKIINNKDPHEPELYGAVTQEAVSNLIINNPNRKRIICMAITSTEYGINDGSPSSWSAAIDELISGHIDGVKKLFVVSAGNTSPEEWKYYPTSNLTSVVQDPAQSWNAISVGAYTEKCEYDFATYGVMDVLAESGQLSPHSTTSLMWNDKWPIKPEIVLEGGNVIKDSSGLCDQYELSLLTTHHKPLERQFTTMWATSAATAEASYMVAELQNRYPNAWPETIRGLLIHSAEWTDAMKKQFLTSGNKTDRKRLLRICGYGVPSLDRAIKCANSCVNLIMESEIQPFYKVKSEYKTKDMNIHEIPWPKEALENLFDTPVDMKVTLSYFIQPGPGQVGWKDRYKYPSCGLRFDVNGSDTKEEFEARISKAMAEEMDITQTGNGGIQWDIGSRNRTTGSIHSDTWHGTAADLAMSNYIAVYPAAGWWKERKHLGYGEEKIRYSLIISISTPKTNIDLYTPIINKIENKIKIEVDIK